MTAMQTQIPITIVHDREVIAEQQVYDSGRKCTGTGTRLLHRLFSWLVVCFYHQFNTTLDWFHTQK